MSDKPTAAEVHQLLVTIGELRDSYRIAYVASCSSSFERDLSALIEDARQQLPRIETMNARELQEVHERFKRRLGAIVRDGVSKFDLAKQSQISNADLCEMEHQRIIAGKCPWCGQSVKLGEVERPST